MPSDGGARLVVEGREDVAEFRESVRVVRRAGRVAGTAMLGYLESCLKVGRIKRFSIHELFQIGQFFPGLL